MAIKNGILKDSDNNIIFPKTIIDNVDGLNELLGNEDTTYIYIWDTSMENIAVALEVPNRNITWQEYFDKYAGTLENGFTMSTYSEWVQYGNAHLKIKSDPSGLIESVSLTDTIDIKRGSSTVSCCYFDGNMEL